MAPRVLFVSKPIAPPFHDGSKCLVRDVARHLTRVDPVLLSTHGAPQLRSAVRAEPLESMPVYAGAGDFAPTITQNLRVAAWLLFRAQADIWHFVFAPNLRSSRIGRGLSRLRRVKTLQTIASPPRRFDDIEHLLFADIVVAQSEWTHDRVRTAYDEAGIPPEHRPRLEVIPPPVDELAPRSAEAQRAVRESLRIGFETPVFVYPGDLETSNGARTVADIAPMLQQELGAVTVFAYRNKTARAPIIARELSAQLGDSCARFTNSLPDVLALIAGSAGVLFPVDDLWGKVDLPVVLLESMALGVPVVALDWGPLRDLRNVHFVRPGDRADLLSAAARILRDPAHRAKLVEAQRAEVDTRFSARSVASHYEQLYVELLSQPNSLCRS